MKKCEAPKIGKKTKTPKTPDFTGAAKNQTAVNKKAWEEGITANRPNQVNEMGSMTWEKDPTSGQWTQRVQYNEPQKKVSDQYWANQGDVQKLAGQAIGGYDASQIDLSKAPKMPTVGGYNQQAMDTIRALQSPQLERQRAAKEAQLAAMGVGTGSGNAWNTEQQNIGDRENRADMEAIMGGLQQGNTEFNQGMQLHQTGTQDIINERTANLGQMSGLMGLGERMTNPEFANVANVGTYNPADQMAALNSQYQANVNKTNAKNADNSNTMGTIGTVATVAATAF